MNIPSVPKAKYLLLSKALSLYDYHFTQLNLQNQAREWDIDFNDMRSAAIILFEENAIDLRKYEYNGGKHVKYTGEENFFSWSEVHVKPLPRGRALMPQVREEYLADVRTRYFAARQQYEQAINSKAGTNSSTRLAETYQIAKAEYEAVRDQLGGDPTAIAAQDIEKGFKDLLPLARNILDLKYTISNTLAKQGGQPIFAHTFKNEVNTLRLHRSAETREDLQIFFQALYELFCEETEYPDEKPAIIAQIARLRADLAHDLQKDNQADAKQARIGDIYESLIGKALPTQVDDFQQVQWATLKRLEQALSDLLNETISEGGVKAA